MLKMLGKTLLVLIATMMVADPLMACCFPTSLESTVNTEASTTQADKLPCHGSKSADTSGNTDPAGSGCPGCGDCTSMMSAAEHVEASTLISSIFEFELEAVNAASLDFTNSQIPVATKIPNGPLPRVVSTPVTLKLKLHV